MLARLQQLICLSLLATATALIAVGVQTGRLWLGPAFVAAVSVGYTSVLAIEFALLLRSFGRDDPERPTVRQILSAWASEVTGTPRIFFWRQPFRSRIEPDHLPATGMGRRGVLLVHGFLCNRGFWNPWMRPLRAAGVSFVAVNLEPVLGSLDDYHGTLSAAARALERATGLPPVVVAHSMGGLAVRVWLAAERDAAVHRVVTIASPHAGTRLGSHLQSTNMRQMREGSTWLSAFAIRETAALRERFICFWSHCDNIVFPTRSATLAGADNRHVAGTPHVQLAFHPQVMGEVFRLLDISTAV